MRILILCQHYYPETFSVTGIAESLVRRGHEVLVVTGKPNYGFGRILEGYENIEDEVIQGVRVHRCSLKPRRDSRLSIIQNYLSFWRSSKRYVRGLKEEFDVVYSVSLSPIISVVGANIYAKKHNVPHVLHCLDLWPESVAITGAIKKKTPMYRLLYHWSRGIYSKTSKILVSSPSFADYFKGELKLPNHPLCYVAQPAILGKASETVSYGHKYNLVYAGNIGRLQLMEPLVEAIDIARKKVDVCLHLIGMGAKEKRILELIESLSLQDNVLFYGTKRRDITAGYYASATGLIVTLKNEVVVGKTIPNKLVSSLYFEKPILACIGGDGQAVLQEAGGAVFAENETKEAFAGAIVELCSKSDAERSEMGKRNKEYYESHFDFERIVDQIEDQLSQAVALQKRN